MAEVRYFAAAAEAAGLEQESLDAPTVGDLKALLAERYGAPMQRVLAAGSFLGFETLAVIVGYVTVWPVGVPLAIAGIAVFATVRSRIQKRRQPDPSVG